MIAVAGWLFFAAVLAGLYHYGLRPDAHWTPAGWARLGLFAAAGAGVTAVLVVRKVRRVALWFVAAWILYGTVAAGPAPVAAAVWIAVSSWALGRILFPRIEEALLASALGIAGWILAFEVLVHFPVNRPWVWWLLTAVPLVVAAAKRVPAPSLPEADTMGEKAWWCVLMVLLTAHFMLQFKPEVSADGLSWHLLAPVRIAAFTVWPFDVTEFAWAAMPMGGDWLWTLSYLFGGETGARLMNFTVLALTTGLVASRTGVAAAALWASTPLVMLTTGSLFVENVWAYLLLAAFLIAWEGGDRPWAVALLAAGATICKLMAVPLAVPIVAWALWKSRNWKPAALFLLAGTMPYVEEVVRTGNPFFPYFNGIFKSPWYPSENSLKDVRYSQTLNWRSLWDMTFRTNLYCESPGGGFGFQWLALMPAAFYPFIRRKDAVIRAALALGAAEVVIVFFGQPYVRYMYAALLLWTLAIGKASESVSWKWLMAAVCGLNLLYFANAGWYHRDFIIEPLTEPSKMAQYTASSAPLTPLIDYANRKFPDQAVAFLSQDGAAWLMGRAWLNTWHGAHFAEDVRRAKTAADARKLMALRGVQLWIGPADDYPELFWNVASWELSDPGQSQVVYRSGAWVLYRMKPAATATGRRYRGPGNYDELARGMRMSGDWIRDKQFAEAWKSTLMYCDKPSCEAEFDFEGSAVTLIHTRAFNRGQAEILIDGKPVATLDAYGPKIEWQQRVRYDAGGAGRHTLTIRVTGRKSPQSQGAFVDIDGYVVE